MSGEWKLSRSQIYEMLLDIYGIFLEAEKTKIDCICIYIYVRQVKLNLLFFPLSIFGGMSLSASYILHFQNRCNKATCSSLFDLDSVMKTLRKKV